MKSFKQLHYRASIVKKQMSGIRINMDLSINDSFSFWVNFTSRVLKSEWIESNTKKEEGGR